MLWLNTPHEIKSRFPLTRHPAFSPINALVLIGACVVVGLHYQASQAATSTTANLDGYKINTGNVRTGTFSTVKVTVKQVSTGAFNTSTANPYNFNALASTSAGASYVVSVSPTSVAGYTVKGVTWCLNTCTGFNEQTTNFRAGSSAAFTFYAGSNYHMRWIFQPVAAPTPIPAPINTTTPAPATPAPSTATPSSTASPVPQEPAFNTDAPREVTFTSDDRVASVTLPAGSIGDQAICSVSDSTVAVSVPKGQTKVAGPYRLLCKSRIGETVNAFVKPVTWHYQLKERMKSGLVPKAYVLAGGGKREIEGAVYNKTAGGLTFNVTDTGDTLVLASSAPAPYSVLAAVGLGFVVLLLGVAALFFLRLPIKRSYADYIRSKYYDL